MPWPLSNAPELSARCWPKNKGPALLRSLILAFYELQDPSSPAAHGTILGVLRLCQLLGKKSAIFICEELGCGGPYFVAGKHTPSYSCNSVLKIDKSCSNHLPFLSTLFCGAGVGSEALWREGEPHQSPPPGTAAVSVDEGGLFSWARSSVSEAAPLPVPSVDLQA